MSKLKGNYQLIKAKLFESKKVNSHFFPEKFKNINFNAKYIISNPKFKNLVFDSLERIAHF